MRWPWQKSLPTTQNSGDSDDFFTLDLTTQELAENHGWERWEVYPGKKRFNWDFCGGGPPDHREVWEYELRGTSLFVRLIENSKEWFDGPRYCVFNGLVVRAQLDDEYEKRAFRWKDADEEIKRIMLRETPDIEQAQLEKQLVWHDVAQEGVQIRMQGALRYIVLATSSENRKFLIAEYYRLREAFAAVEGEAQQLGALWDISQRRYQAPADATEETKKAIREGLCTNKGLLRFGIWFQELREREDIMAVFKDRRIWT